MELNGARLLDAAKHLEEAAVRLGLVCSNCGLPLEDLEPAGYDYVSIEPVPDPANPAAPVNVAVHKDKACMRTTCKEYREHLDRTATARKVITRPWELLTGPPETPFGGHQALPNGPDHSS